MTLPFRPIPGLQHSNSGSIPFLGQVKPDVWACSRSVEKGGPHVYNGDPPQWSLPLGKQTVTVREICVLCFLSAMQAAFPVYRQEGTD